MSESPENLLHWKFFIDRESIVWATFDRAGSSANALGRKPIEELAKIVEYVQNNFKSKKFKGLIFVSGKEKSFIVGADINEFENMQTEKDVIEEISNVNSLFDQIENLKLPVIAAVHGVCVGGGLEFILACHYRIATHDPSTRFGFPEVKLGIFPGFNGTVRSVRQIGPINAMQMMLSGSMIAAKIARSQGLIDETVVSADALRWAARKAVLSNRKSKHAGFYKSIFSIWPLRKLLTYKLRKELSKKIQDYHYPAPFRLIDLYDNYGGSYEKMKKQEPVFFAPLMVSEQSRNLRRVFKLSETLKAQAPRTLKWRPSRVHIIGAGTMGADIAGICVLSGMEVTLQDISSDQIKKGMEAQVKLFQKKFKTRASLEAAKARLIPDPEGKGISRADVVIEAIIEKLELKQKLFKEIEGKIKKDTIIATNTSSLKLSDISSHMESPYRLIGLHFFSPVSLMPLVEVVKTEMTKEEEISKGAIFVTSIEKFPLITKDVPGFLVNKVLGPYMYSAISRVEMGENKDFIDEAIRAFGMPMGPIELADSVGLDVCMHVAKAFAHKTEGTQLGELVKQGKLGKKTGEGFYKWEANKALRGKNQKSRSELEKYGRELIEPLLIEANKALSENVVANADLVDAGLIFGVGFAPFRGGPLHYLKNEKTKLQLSE